MQLTSPRRDGSEDKVSLLLTLVPFPASPLTASFLHTPQGYDPYAGIDKQTMEVLKFQDSAHVKLALKVR